MNQLELDDIPNELLPSIFRHLDLSELINCRLLSKKYRYFIDTIIIDELII